MNFFNNLLNKIIIIIRKYFFTVVIFLLLPNNSYSLVTYNKEEDLYIRNSKRCSRYFEYFEKKYKLPKFLLKSISLVETGRWYKPLKIHTTWPWSVNVEGQPYYFNNKYEAVKFVKKIKEKGKTNIDVGCMQINLHYHSKAFRNLNNAFEPRENIEYAAKFLLENFNKFNTWEKAVAAYHSQSHFGQKYSTKVTDFLIKEHKKTNNIDKKY